MKLFEKFNNIEKNWKCNDVDIFILNDYDKVVNHFKDNLRKKKYEIEYEKIKLWNPKSIFNFILEKIDQNNITIIHIKLLIK